MGGLGLSNCVSVSRLTLSGVPPRIHARWPLARGDPPSFAYVCGWDAFISFLCEERRSFLRSPVPSVPP